MPQLVAVYDDAGVRKMMAAIDRISNVDKVERALHEGVRAAGDKVRTKVRRALHRQMGTKKYGTIVKATRSYIPGRMSYAIEGMGKGLPITDFPVKAFGGDAARMRWSPTEHWRYQVRAENGRFGRIDLSSTGKAGVTARPWRVTHDFKRSFVDAEGIFRARLPDQKRGKGRKLYGPAAWKEIVRAETLATFQGQAPREMEAQVGKRLAKLVP